MYCIEGWNDYGSYKVLYQTSTTQNMPNILPSWAICGMFIVTILGKIDL